ncbi:DUF4192 family protein [Corynebacterium sp. USCH3]|uniref:DUF4192 family protein n=1 Tax=Corynebacterium sp. USCH3 TaxID=3024840 RepID=UPI0030B4A381
MTSTQHNSSHHPRIPGAPTRVVIDDGTAGLIAAVPGLLGFTPSASIVMIGLTCHGEHLESVGPVVRTDIIAGAATAGADALCGAVYDMPGAKAAVIVVAPDAWPLPGRVVEALVATMSELCENSVDVSGVYVVEAIRAGERWLQVVPTGVGVGWQVVGSGTVSDPACSPMLSSGMSSVHDSRASSASLDRSLDPLDYGPGTPSVPETWSTGSGGTGDQARLVPSDVRDLVIAVADEAVHLHRADEPPLVVARRAVRKLLEVTGTATTVHAVCTRTSLFPTLVALGAGGSATVVIALLLETAGLARSSLRSRALVLIAVLGWCGNHGALGHRAARRCLQEMEGPGGLCTRPGFMEDHDRLGDDLLTMTLAGVLRDGVSDGSAAGTVGSILSQGISQIDSVRGAVPTTGRDAEQTMWDRILDRGAVNAVRNVLDRRAAR